MNLPRIERIPVQLRMNQKPKPLVVLENRKAQHPVNLEELKEEDEEEEHEKDNRIITNRLKRLQRELKIDMKPQQRQFELKKEKLHQSNLITMSDKE